MVAHPPSGVHGDTNRYSRGRLCHTTSAQDMATKRRQHAGGFTLLELLVVSILMIGLAMMTAQLWKHYMLQTADLSARTGAAQELRLALDGLAGDFGNVVWACPTADQGLLLCCEAPGGQSYPLIQYSVVQGRLVRTDQAAGTAVTIAANVSALTVSQVTPSVLQITVHVTAGSVTRSATLFWSPP